VEQDFLVKQFVFLWFSSCDGNHPFHNGTCFWQNGLRCISSQHSNGPIFHFPKLQERLRSAFLIVAKTRYQGRQMVYFQTQNPNLGNFWRVLQWKTCVYFGDIWSNLQPSGLLHRHLVNLVVIWYNFSPFWYVVPRKIWQPCSVHKKLFSICAVNQQNNRNETWRSVTSEIFRVAVLVIVRALKSSHTKLTLL
jgi:hypothetical protein